MEYGYGLKIGRAGQRPESGNLARVQAELHADGVTVLPSLVIDFTARVHHVRRVNGAALTTTSFAAFIAAT